MSLKSELLIYSAALEAFDTSNLSLSLSHFSKISETSKIQWNMGIILATMGRHNEAIKRFGESVVMDQYLVVGWFQRGVSYFMVGMYALAVKDFEMAFLYMRDNRTINYTQLGLAHLLHSAEILYNLGLTKIYLGQTAAGMQDLRRAQEQKSEPDHQVIDDCVRDQGRAHNVFSAGLLFRPSESKLKNIKTRDYMGKAILISATDSSDEFTSFTGITRLQRGQTPQGVPLDASHPLSRSKSSARSASVSNLQPPSDSLENLPIATRMTTTQRSQTQIGRKPPSTPGLGLSLTRSLTISNPDPYPSSPRSPMGHARSKTVDSPGTSDFSRDDVSRNVSDGRPVRPRIVIPAEGVEWDPRARSDRYPPFRTEKGKLQPPSAYPQASPTTSYQVPHNQIRPNPPSSLSRSPSTRINQWQSSPGSRLVDDIRSNTQQAYHTDRPEILQTPKDRFTSMEDIYDDYHSPTQTPDLVDDTPEMPYTAIGQAFTGVSPISRPKEMYTYTPQRAPSRSGAAGMLERSNTYQSTTRRQGQGQGQGLMLTVKDGSPSPCQMNDLVKIRIKVHVGKHTRGMSILPSDSYAHLVNQLRSKFPELHRHQEKLSVNFRDEDGDMLSMQDEGDFEAAVDVARVMSQGRAEGKLEIWVE